MVDIKRINYIIYPGIREKLNISDETKKINNILNIVSKYYRISIDDIRSKRRYRNLVTVRALICYISIVEIRKNSYFNHGFISHTFKMLGDILNRDRTNIYHYIRLIDNLKQYDKNFSKQYLEIASKIQNHEDNKDIPDSGKTIKRKERITR